MKLTKKRSLLLLTVPVLILSACKKDNNPVQPIYGPTAPLGQGAIRSFVIIDGAGKPVTVGMKFSSSSLTGLPSDTTKDWEYPLDLPDQAKVTGFDHLVVDWNPIGHEPKAIYGLPHFDFHFYRISKDEQQQVQAGPDNVPVPPQYIPKDYFTGGIAVAVPDMGVHWVDSLAPEFRGNKFTDTFIYGFYHGQLTFMEGMATTAWIATKPDFKIQIKQPAAFQKSGYYPTVSHIYYDQSTDEYIMALEGLQWHDAK